MRYCGWRCAVPLKWLVNSLHESMVSIEREGQALIPPLKSLLLSLHRATSLSFQMPDWHIASYGCMFFESLVVVILPTQPKRGPLLLTLSDKADLPDPGVQGAGRIERGRMMVVLLFYFCDNFTAF